MPKCKIYSCLFPLPLLECFRTTSPHSSQLPFSNSPLGVLSLSLLVKTGQMRREVTDHIKGLNFTHGLSFFVLSPAFIAFFLFSLACHTPPKPALHQHHYPFSLPAVSPKPISSFSCFFTSSPSPELLHTSLSPAPHPSPHESGKYFIPGFYFSLLFCSACTQTSIKIYTLRVLVACTLLRLGASALLPTTVRKGFLHLETQPKKPCFFLCYRIGQIDRTYIRHNALLGKQPLCLTSCQHCNLITPRVNI